MRIAYFDCFSGISGDMILGALIDAGLQLKTLKKELLRLPLKGYEITTKKVIKQSISSTKFEVIVNHGQHERNINEIIQIIDKSSLIKDIKEDSKKIFLKIAQAEAKIHNKQVSSIHFHEIGAIDSIIDIVGTVIGVNVLGIEKIYSSDIPLGKGFVEFSHGKYPIPAPATIELLKGIATYQTDIQHELVTPTGIGIISTLSDEFGYMPKLKPVSIGYGAGTAELQQPNVLRIIIGESSMRIDEFITDIIETNIDDMNPEYYNYIMERLFKLGALDVFLTNILMKKNRPGIKLTVISSLEKTDDIVKIITTETTSLGVRVYQAKRSCIQRDFANVHTRYGIVKVKLGKIGEQVVNIHPEYEDCVRIAEKYNIPIKRVYEIVIKCFKEL